MRWLLLVLGFGVATSCYPGQNVSDIEISGDPPVARITVVDSSTDGRRIGLILEESTDWRSLVELEVFGDFRPAMSHEEALLRFGPPDETRGASAIYERSLGRVEIVRVTDRSAGDVFEQWQVRARPKRNRIEDLFAPALSAQITPLLEERSVVVLMHPSQYQPVIRARLAGKWVETVIWYGE